MRRKSPDIDREQLLLTGDVAKILDLTPEGVRWLARDGQLPFTLITKRGVRLFNLADVKEFQEARRKRLAKRVAGGVQGERPMDAA